MENFVMKDGFFSKIDWTLGVFDQGLKKGRFVCLFIIIFAENNIGTSISCF